MAAKCEIQLAYAIGISEPVSINVNTYGTGRFADDKISEIIWREFDLTPEAIITDLDLKRPIYQKTASYGHFGRNDLELTWERTDRVEALLRYLLPLGKVV